MAGGAIGRFSSQEQYEASLSRLKPELVLSSYGHFDARLTEASSPGVTVLCARESLPRVAYLAMPPSYFCVSVPLQSPSMLIINGVAVQRGEMVFHREGEAAHHRTVGASSWSLVMLAKRCAHSRHNTARAHIGTLPTGCTVRSPPREHRRVVRLVGQMARRAEYRPLSLTDPHIAAGLERELVQALNACVGAAVISAQSVFARHCQEVMGRFESALSNGAEQPLPLVALCQIAGVSDRTLRTCCARFLGCSPGHYMRLRRLKLARAAILRVDNAGLSIGELARQHGFTELGRFAVTYRSIFGESPSATQRRIRGTTTASETA